MSKLAGKVAFVTGSSRGVGKLVAQALAKQGADVVVHGRTAKACEETLKLVREAGVRGAIVSGELSDPAQVERIATEALAAFGRIDILYNNAAVQAVWRPEGLAKQELSDWTTVFQINVFALVRLTARIVPQMVARGWGRVVNLTSGIDKTWQLAAYGASKWAVDKFTDDSAAELAGTGVIVSRIDPGWLRTDLGGPNADNAPETVLPGALVPVLLPDDAPGGRFFRAQELRDAVI
ncbi:MAG TPA: SDR family oxidoreductase [Fibrobacteria bacterium]|nr:SDR family oxidoreductase [Fibrobacteria bacterium]